MLLKIKPISSVLILSFTLIACGGGGGGGSGGGGSTTGVGGTGTNTLTSTSSEPIGANCGFGGFKIETGQDSNNNGSLDSSEVSSTSYDCFVQLSANLPEPSGPNCDLGGLSANIGIDSNRNTILETNEITSSTYQCHGKLSGSPVNVSEDEEQINFVIQLPAQEIPLTLNYQTEDATAEAEEDFQLSTGSITFSPGETEKIISVAMIDDKFYECDEQFSLTLTDTNQTLSVLSTITNGSDDFPFIQTTPQITKVKENAGSVEVNVTVNGGVCEQTTVSIQYAGTATNNADYQSVGTVTFEPGVQKATLTLPILDDDIKEDGETIILNFTPTPNIQVSNTQEWKVSIQPVIEDIYGGYDNACLKSVDGIVKCWGNNRHYNLANGSNDTKGDSFGEATAKVVSCNSKTADVLFNEVAFAKDNGETCSTLGGLGYQLGLDENANDVLDSDEISLTDQQCFEDQTQADQFMFRSQPLPMSSECDLGGIALYSGSDSDDDGLLTFNEMGEDLPFADIGSDNIVDIGLGNAFSCALTDASKVKCWGENKAGKLGLGLEQVAPSDTIGDSVAELGDALAYVNIGTNLAIEELSVGYDHACVLLDNNRIKCWGSNLFGQLGYGDIISRGDTPATIGDNLPFVDLGTDSNGQPWEVKQVFAGDVTSCALFTNEMIKCWGDGQYAKSGLDDVKAIGNEPNEMGNNLPFVDLGTNLTVKSMYFNNRHSCAVLSNGDVKCWGDNSSGQLGIETPEVSLGDGGATLTAFLCNSTLVDALIEIMPINNVGTCTDNGLEVLRGFDQNGNGFLDNDETTFFGLYFCDTTELTAIAQVTDLAVGSAQCPVAGGIAVEAGLDTNGAFDNEMGDILASLDITNSDDIEQMNLAEKTSCALFTDNSLNCWGNGRLIGLDQVDDWGDNFGETPSNLPDIDTGTALTVEKIVGKGTFNCVLMSDNEIRCFGYSNHGALGDASNHRQYIGDGLNSEGEAEIEMGDELIELELF